MAALSSDFFSYVGSPGTATLLASPGHAIGGTGITVTSTSNWPIASGAIFAIDVVDSAGKRINNTYTEWEGIVTSATTIASLILRYGSDQNYPAGSTTRVYIPVASSRENRLVDGLSVSLNQDGTLKVGAVNNTAALASNVVTTVKILDASVTTAKIADTNVTNAKLAADISPAKFSNPYKFSAYALGVNSLGLNTWTKLAFNTKEYDTGANFDAVTNNRFTAPAAGFYQFSGAFQVTAGGPGDAYDIALYKNGALFKEGVKTFVGAAGTSNLTISPPAFQLAAGDYVELWGYNGTAGGKSVTAYQNTTYFGGYLVSAN